MNSLGLVLEQYPDEVIVFITDPRTGIQRRNKWPPMISEIVEACDERVADLNRAERYRNWGVGGPELIEAPRENRPSLEELKAKYGPNWGIDADDRVIANRDRPAPSWDSVTEAYAADPSRIAALTTKDGE